jgi:hypothetical protein
MSSIFIGAFAQTPTTGVRLTIGAAGNSYNYSSGTAISVGNSRTLKSMTFQIGAPFMGVNQLTTSLSSSTYSFTNLHNRLDIGFPWGELFINKTFSKDQFTVSKGYFPDRVEMNWRVTNNANAITSYLVYRTDDLSSSNPVWGDPIKTVSRTENTFVDLTAEGGKLYRYKLKALGVVSQDADSEFNNYITAVGYRNPTGIVSGNISFLGGNPVKDVLVAAVAEGGTSQLGTSIVVPSDGNVWVPKLRTGLKDAFSVQFWINYANASGSGDLNLVKLISNSGDEINSGARFSNSGNTLTINIGSTTYSITGYLPSGKLNNKGDDTFETVRNSINNFIHVSFVLTDNQVPTLYLNGRPMTADYFTYMNGLLGSNSASLITSGATPISLNTNSNGNAIEWTSLKMGGGVTSYFDDARIWGKGLTKEEIRTTYKRYIRGDENSLRLYLRFNENGGSNAYDMSFKGSLFNGNDAQFTRTSGSTTDWWNVLVPTSDQLGILGVTDAFGNYSISAIPYSGNGELFKITPSLGVHKFSPKQETLFIGVSSSVVNRVNFIDESSFTFRGRALYDSRGVFPAGPSTDDVTGDIRDGEAYNAYVKGNLKYPKGEYWAEYGLVDNVNRIVRLKRYAPIPLVGAYVYVDNNMVVDANNAPVLTDAAGRFNIKVPIGNHSVTVKSTWHTLAYEGRFPARDSLVANGSVTYTNTYKEFFEDQDEEVTFIDNTKVSVVGRVVGGSVESAKPIGFGYNGRATVAVPGTNPVVQAEISSKNNIGTAQITFGYRQPGVSSITAEYKTVANTNSVTGEYRMTLLPLAYELDQNDVYIASQNSTSTRRFLTANQNLNFSSIPVSSVSYFTYKNTKGESDTLATSIPFHYRKDFIYKSSPIVAVLEQNADAEIEIGDNKYQIASSNTTPIYTQFKDYSIKFQKQERYYNFEKASDQQMTMVPAQEGDFVITNNIALPNSEKITEDSTDKSKMTYTFKGGLVNTDVGTSFRRTMSAVYRLNGTDYAIPGFKTTGIVLGGASDGSQGVITQGPDKVDFILRDPPGSGSSATLQKGSEVSIKQKNAGVISSDTKIDLLVKAGAKFALGGGILGPAVETNIEAETGGRVHVVVSSTNGKELTTTYAFDQTISTSSSADVVGASGDLYIGKSDNFYYGLYDEIKATDSLRRDRNNNDLSIPIATTQGTKYITKTKAMSFTPDGTPTIFIYSQDYVLKTLLPFYENILYRIETNNTAGLTNLKSKDFYKNSIKAWKMTILRNEIQKYMAYKQRDDLKKSVKEAILSKYRIAGVLTKAGGYLQSILDDQFFRNITIDAKAGSFASSAAVGSTTVWTSEFEISAGVGLVLENGIDIGGQGFTLKMENENTLGYNYSQEENVDTKTTVGYTIADNDANNVLSVDVVNTFDGNGPVFITQGGASSCPIEVGEKSNFFTTPMLANYKANNFDTLTINRLVEAKKVELSKGSLALEVPDIMVERASISGVPETGKAAFKFTLMNLSAVEPESANFKLKLNPNSNPNGARLSIDANGVPITLNGTTAVEYTVFVEKGRADVYDYNNLEIVFESACDGSVSKSIRISTSFVQSCTKVDIARPSNNWVMNATNSYSNGSTVPLGIVLNGFNANYAGFKKMVLHYRMQGSPNWTTLKNYVANQTEKTAMITAGTEAATIEIIAGTELSFGWDVAALGLADGNYEIRAVSYCANGTIYETTPVTGKVDMISPILFGTPSPTDGILSIGEDIKIKFSEPVKANGTMTRVDFLVQKNQLPVAHEVALSFTGTTSKANIVSPYLKSGDFSVEFWLKNGTSTVATMIAQENGFNVKVSNNTMTFTVGAESVTANIATDGAYHHYTLSYANLSGRFTIIEDDLIAKTEVKRASLFVDNNSEITLGGTGFTGKAHELRFWNTAVSRESSVANMNVNLNGNEDGLIGYWPMNEGHGNLAKDQSRYKHITLDNVNWDIFPNGQSYTFDGTNHLALTNASKSIFSSTMDGTISFWMKSSTPGPAALLSNGKGDDTDPLTTSGYRNKWSIELDDAGKLALKAENKSYSFGTKNLADGQWHHVAVVVKRRGNMSMYVDGIQSVNHPVTGLGGFSGSTVFLGGRGQISQSNQVTVDRNFTGQLDEVQIWNMARQADQINEDQYYEQDFQTTGLVLYAPLNRPEQTTTNGPKYYVPLDFQTKVSDYAALSSGSSLAYSNVTPAVKPVRNTERMVVNTVINGDEMIINPQITNWASIEKKIAYITVANMYDMTDNRQESPITWTAYINKNPLNWYLEGYDANLDVAVNEGKSDSYNLVIANVGGLFQDYSIELPTWLQVKNTAGVMSPNSQVKLAVSIDPTLSPGKYFDELKLRSNYGYTEKIRANLRVLKTEPDWGLNPLDFEENMNVVGKVKVDGIFSKDGYDRVIALSVDSVRGVAPIIYDKDYDEYYAMLTIYGSTESAGSPINFKIWDASAGRLKAAAVNDQTTLTFQPNAVLGNYQSPAIFANSGFETQIVNLNKGWTWLSFNVQDSTFNNLNTFFKSAKVAGGDVIKTFGPALFDVYNVSPVAGLTGWGGTISLNGGLSASKMYRAKISNAQKILATGNPVSLANASFTLSENWNGLPYVASRNLSINEALAYLDASNGDQIKSQSQFAIYDGVTRKWKGNLTTMNVGEGYMIKTARAQSFRYPDYANQMNTLSENVLSTNSAKVVGEDADMLGDPIVDSKPVVMSSNLYKYAETMNVVAELPAEFEAAEFYNPATNEVVSLSQTVTMNKKKYLFTTLYADKTENIKVRLIKDGVATEASNVITFASNQLVGSLQEPYQFKFEKEGASGLYTYPNPFTSELMIEFWSDQEGPADIQIFDLLARPVDSKQVQAVKGMNAVKYNTSKMTFGSYVVKVSAGDRIYTKTVIKN